MMVFKYHTVSEAGHRELQDSQLFTFTSSTAMERMKHMFLHATEAVRETIHAKCWFCSLVYISLLIFYFLTNVTLKRLVVFQQADPTPELVKALQENTLAIAQLFRKFLLEYKCLVCHA